MLKNTDPDAKTYRFLGERRAAEVVVTVGLR
jgi:hypothetical protein